MSPLLALRFLLTLLALSARPEGGGGRPDAPAADQGGGAAAAEPPSIVPPRPPAPRPAGARFAAAVPLLALLATLLTAGLWLWRQARPDGPPAALRGDEALLAFALVALSAWAIYLLWRVPQWQATAWAEQGGADPREQFEIENASRATLGQILSGVAVLAGLVFAWQQLGSTARSVRLTEESVRVSQEGQITDRFTRAVEQLGSGSLSLRLGGVYALERIARDSERDYVAAMEVLAAFVRQPGPVSTASPAALVAPPADVAAAFKVIARRTPDQLALQRAQGVPCIDLSAARLAGATLPSGANLADLCLNGADLRGAALPAADFSGSELAAADLSEAALQGTRFTGADLTGADLSDALLADADLAGARLVQANLAGATLAQASLRGASLLGANLAGALLFGTDLRGADFAQATLTDAAFAAADLRDAVHLTAEQLDAAQLDRATVLPVGVAATPDF